MSWFRRLKQGLSKTSSSFADGIRKIFSHAKPDAVSLDEVEELLITMDLGVEFATEVRAELARQKFTKGNQHAEIIAYLNDKISRLLKPLTTPIIIEHKPQVILVCGVNGNGKTTTIGKLANQWHNEGKKVIIAACDTFRAAAVEQLQVWAERSNSVFVSGSPNADPASVAHNALLKAKEQQADVLLIDTAGRLQNKSNLMEELAKIARVLKKIDPNTPHNAILVLDATTGQNALNQAEVFSKMININGLIVTKLDGSARAGIVVALAKNYKLPIHGIGIGEGIDDLRSFIAEEFAAALLEGADE
jgi:fused signal recognition particle receptor